MEDKLSEKYLNTCPQGQEKPNDMDLLRKIDELEALLVSAGNALTRWYSRCLKYADIVNGNTMDVLVLQTVDRRSCEISLTDICLTLHIEDQHVVNYALKKLVRHDLVQRLKRGKKVFYSSTEKGNQLCIQFIQLKEQYLAPLYDALDDSHFQLNSARKIMTTLIQTYSLASQQVILS